jgi:hypothetical protein
MRILNAILIVNIICGLVRGDSTTVGPLGINANIPLLDGTGIRIGMVEAGRPGRPGIDSDDYTHEQVIPFQVFAGTSPDGMDSQFVMGIRGQHALHVASVMKARSGEDVDLVGVAPGALLYAAADLQNDLDVSFGLAANRIARVDGMRVINVSYGRELLALESTDGSAHWTEFIDWSTIAHDVLYIVGGDYEDVIAPIPTDNFNGITVGASDRTIDEPNGHFRQVWAQTVTDFDPEGVRTAIDLLAPGVSVGVAFPNNGFGAQSGTSFAAPHVTGAVALLQRFAVLESSEPVFNPRFVEESYKQPEVMKAILLNSADKLNDVHGSQREIIKKNGNNWINTIAYTSPFQSLDEEMGAGHLNVKSAIENFRPGEYEPGSVPPIGWDFGSIGGFGTMEYVFDQAVSGWVAITLAWNRIVQSTELAGPRNYVTGDQFFSTPLNNLDLYLRDANNNSVVSSSTTFDDNLEHIFVQVPSGQYKIQVHYNDLGDDLDYGLAWWAGEAPPTTQPGDFNGDTRVNGLDFLAWQRGQSPNPLSASDLADWQNNYGAGSLAATTAVPEPSCLILLFGFMLLRRR